MNSNWINDMNIRARTIKLLEENRFVALDLVIVSWIRQQIHNRQQEKISKLDFIKIKNFFGESGTPVHCCSNVK